MSAHVLVVAFVWLLAAVAVGVHAMDRDRSGFLWGLLTMFTGLIGVTIYLIVVGTELDDPDRGKDVVVCPSCDARHEGSPEYCSECGESLEAAEETSTASVIRSGSTAHCGNCSARVDFDADACPSCGSVF